MNIDQPFRADLDIARRLAVLASEIALRYFHRGVSAETKPDGTPVTVADRDIEQTLLQALIRLRACFKSSIKVVERASDGSLQCE